MCLLIFRPGNLDYHVTYLNLIYPVIRSLTHLSITRSTGRYLGSHLEFHWWWQNYQDHLLKGSWRRLHVCCGYTGNLCADEGHVQRWRTNLVAHSGCYHYHNKCIKKAVYTKFIFLLFIVFRLLRLSYSNQTLQTADMNSTSADRRDRLHIADVRL